MKFKKDNEGNLYTDGSIDENLWERYTRFSGGMAIISRLEPIEYPKSIALKKFNQFNSVNKQFVQVPDLYDSTTNFLSYKVRSSFNEIIREKVKETDFLVVRLPSSEGYLAIKYAKKYRKPYLIEVVGCPKDSLWNHSLKGKLLAYPNYFIMKQAIRDSPFTVYVTSDFLQNRYPSKGEKIGCSDVILEQMNSEVLKRRLLKIEGKKKTSKLTLGTLAAIDVSYKGQEYVIKALAKLKEEGYEFEYYLAGGGNPTYLKGIAENYGVVNQIKFLGTLPHEKIYSFLDTIDIYIQPSKLEGLPRALIEAMSRGCTAMGSNVGGIPELLTEDVLFNKKSIHEICNILKSIDKDFLKQHAERNFIKASEFEKEELEGKRNLFYQKFLGNKVL